MLADPRNVVKRVGASSKGDLLLEQNENGSDFPCGRAGLAVGSVARCAARTIGVAPLVGWAGEVDLGVGVVGLGWDGGAARSSTLNTACNADR